MTMRELSTHMIEAVLDGAGLQGVAELAAVEAGGPVAIVLPPRGLAARAPGGGELNGLAGYAKARVTDTRAAALDPIAMERLIEAGGQTVGVVLLLDQGSGDGGQPVLVDREEVLRAAALAALAEVAVADAREEAERKLRGGLIEELREHEVEMAVATSKAVRLGCDLARGAIALVAEISSASPSHATALVEAEYEGSSPSWWTAGSTRSFRRAAEMTLRRGRCRPRAGSPTAFASMGWPRSPRFIPTRASSIARSRRLSWSSTWSPASRRSPRRWRRGSRQAASYRLLFRALISDPDEVRSFYRDTVEPLVRYDNQYRSDLLGTLEEYLASDCNMNATARAIFAHRHTVAYRLERVKELTGLDPQISEDRERLGLGIKAYRTLAPALPR